MTCAYRREIHHAHVAIRDWLAGDSRADALDALMARFAEDSRWSRRMAWS